MAFPFDSSVVLPKFSVAGVINRFQSVFEQLPDVRKASANRHYEVSDAALSAFGVFFTQSPSFLDYQQRMHKKYGKSNAQSILGIHQLPSMNQVRNLLDPVAPEQVYPLIQELGDGLYQQGYLEAFRGLGGTLLLALDGTDCFASEKIACPHCRRQTLPNGHTLYRHTAITPVIVAPGQAAVVPLAPEFVQPQDGTDKQDCELAAAKRWLSAWGAHYAPWGITLLGDDLYSHQPFCQQAIAQGYQLVLVCKPDSHPLLYEWVADFERNGELHTLQRQRWTGQQRLTEHYRYANQLPLRDGDEALMLNWCELTVTDAQGHVVYHNAWVTTHRITDENVVAVAAAGRARWKIENENNNVLKNQGYHFEHNFGHGQQHLSNLLATLIVLAYLLHTALEWLDQTYQCVRRLLPSRRTFFEHLRALMQYVLFESWEQLMAFMLDALDGKIPDTTQ